MSGSGPGHICLWNLEKKQLQSQMREAHDGAVTGMQCLPSEPLMVTSSADNSLKVIISLNILFKRNGLGKLKKTHRMPTLTNAQISFCIESCKLEKHNKFENSVNMLGFIIICQELFV